MTKKEFLEKQRKGKQQRQALQSIKKDLQGKIAELKKVDLSLESELAKGRSASKNVITGIQGQQKELNRQISNIRSSIRDVEANISATINEVIFALDPREQVSFLNDSYPVFLMPVRMETRFMTVKHIVRVSQDVQPDNSPAGFVVRNGRPLAQAISKKVGDVFEQHAALPVIEDTHELWIRIFPDDIAVHTHEEHLTAEEQEAARIFWTHIWYAGDNEDLRLGAWRGLVSGRGPERSAWIAKQMAPTNPEDKPANAIDPEDSLPVEPVFPEPGEKDGNWNQAPHTKVMPDRFVARLYNGTSFREVVGRVIPDSLQLSIDPNTAELDVEAKEGDIKVGEKLAWMQEFDEAEKVGMGIRVALQGLERFQGFDKLLVLGVKTSADQEEGQALLEDLLDNHHYTHGGLSVVPQGTPTNNTEDAKSGYTALNSDNDDLFRVELGDALFAATEVDLDKSDGQHLADALGISYEKVQHIAHADGSDAHEAMCMNRALWPTTLGYYLSQMMFPVFTDEEVTRARDHCFKFILGRGRVPAIRVDDQPYGILPVTAFSKWQYKDKDQQTAFLDKLLNNVLQNMETTWDQLVAQVKHAGTPVPGSQVDALFLNIMGLHATSVEYYQRFVMGPYLLWNLYNYSLFISKSAGTPQPAPYATTLDFLQFFLTENYNFITPPRLFDFYYSNDHKYLDGPLIDKLNLSEIRAIDPIGSQGENYIDWLIKSDWNQVKAEDFSNIGAAVATPPGALLYLMLRHSALLEYEKAGQFILVDKGILKDIQLLDVEFMQMSSSPGISSEVKGLIKRQVEFRESLKLEKDLQKNIQTEFEKRLSEGRLEGLSLKKINAEKQAFREVLGDLELPKLDKRVNEEADRLIAELVAGKADRKSLSSTYTFLKDQTLAEFIDSELKIPEVKPELFGMKELQDALECLKGLPTARLERCFAEHIDLASYRLDAWFYSLVSERLVRLRGSGENRKTGVYLGAFAWLEELRPGSFPGIHYREVEIKPEQIVVPGFDEVVFEKDFIFEGEIGTVMPWNLKKITKATRKKKVAGAQAKKASENIRISGGQTLKLSSKLETILLDNPLLLDSNRLLDILPKYTNLGSGPVGDITYDPTSDRFIHLPRTDPSNQGYIHAPSINHATAAAVLRAGYETHRTNPSSPENTLAVNLSSSRVRRAMFYLEGMRNGQELGALLGYQFERGLHDHDSGLDAYILEFRLEYPLVAGRVTDTTGATSIGEAESYNVINGLGLIEASREPASDYPYGVSNLPPTGTDKALIIEEVRKLHDAVDGINDLLMSESMYQVVQGNYPRANAALNAMSGTNMIAEADVIKTPRNFHALSQRLGVSFDLSPGGQAIWTAMGTPRSLAEPHLNRWLGENLPPDSGIRVNYQYQFTSFNGIAGSVYESSMVLADLGLEPIDLYYMLIQVAEQGESVELADRIGFHIRRDVLAADNLLIQIAFSDRLGFDPAELSFLEVQALMEPLKALVGESRALEARDFLLPTGAEQIISDNPTKGLDTGFLATRLQDVASPAMSNGARGLEGVVDELAAQIINLQNLLSASSLVGGGEDYLATLRSLLLEAASFGAQNAIPTTGIELTEEYMEALLALAQRVLTELQPRLEQAKALFDDLALAGNEGQKSDLLAQAAQQLFGRAFKVFPEYRLYNESNIVAAYEYENYLDHAGPMAVEEWMQGLSPVRKRVRMMRQTMLMAEALKPGSPIWTMDIFQLPLEPLDEGGNPATRWLGMSFPEGYEVPDDNISWVFQTFEGYSPAELQAGILVDEWVEEIPEKSAHTGIAVHYNNPNSEPPQTCLLAVTPDITGNWSWDDLMDTLNETLAWAKKRAVDPDLLSKTHYAQVLPATLAAVSASDDIPTLDYGRNIVPKPKPGKFGLVNILDYQVPKVTFTLDE